MVDCMFWLVYVHVLLFVCVLVLLFVCVLVLLFVCVRALILYIFTYKHIFLDVFCVLMCFRVSFA